MNVLFGLLGLLALNTAFAGPVFERDAVNAEMTTLIPVTGAAFENATETTLLPIGSMAGNVKMQRDVSITGDQLQYEKNNFTVTAQNASFVEGGMDGKKPLKVTTTASPLVTELNDDINVKRKRGDVSITGDQLQYEKNNFTVTAQNASFVDTTKGMKMKKRNDGVSITGDQLEYNKSNFTVTAQNASFVETSTELPSTTVDTVYETSTVYETTMIVQKRDGGVSITGDQLTYDKSNFTVSAQNASFIEPVSEDIKDKRNDATEFPHCDFELCRGHCPLNCVTRNGNGIVTNSQIVEGQSAPATMPPTVQWSNGLNSDIGQTSEGGIVNSSMNSSMPHSVIPIAPIQIQKRLIDSSWNYTSLNISSNGENGTSFQMVSGKSRKDIHIDTTSTPDSTTSTLPPWVNKDEEAETKAKKDAADDISDALTTATDAVGDAVTDVTDAWNELTSTESSSIIPL